MLYIGKPTSGQAAYEYCTDTSLLLYSTYSVQASVVSMKDPLKEQSVGTEVVVVVVVGINVVVVVVGPAVSVKNPLKEQSLGVDVVVVVVVGLSLIHI